jgi:hypothetical protein
MLKGKEFLYKITSILNALDPKIEKESNIRMIHQINAQIIKKCQYMILKKAVMIKSVESFKTYFLTLDDDTTTKHILQEVGEFVERDSA